MLRMFVLLMLLLNGAYFAWGQGWLMLYGFGPASQREPLRMAQQIHPQAIETISEQEAQKVMLAAQEATKPKKLLCLLSPMLDATQAQAVSAALHQAAWPDAAWALEAMTQPEQWLIYMGKYPSPTDLEKKRVQLRGLNIAFEPLSDAALAPGLSLGRFESQAKAEAALATFAQRGVRTAKVLQEHPAIQGVRLRLPAVDESWLEKLTPVRAALGSQTLAPCASE